MNLTDYFTPVSDDITAIIAQSRNNLIGKLFYIHNEKETIADFKNFNLAIIGITDSRPAGNNLLITCPDLIRKQLYTLFPLKNIIKVIDLGNLRQGKTINDTFFALRDTVAELINNKIVPIIIAGCQEFIYPNYLAYEALHKEVNIVSVNSRFDFASCINNFNVTPFLSTILLNTNNFLFNYTNIAYQNYFIDPESAELLNKLLFDSFRLGEIRANIKEIEPVMRDADIISFHINSIKQADAPGQTDASPNGLFSDEACQIARYAGISDKISSFGIYGYYPPLDINCQTAHLAAQIIWHFIDGFYQRKNDYPIANLKDYKKFVVTLNNLQQDLIFYKSPKSDRWWLEVTVTKTGQKRKIIIACSFEDYQKACNKEIPERWWKTYQKIC